MSNHGMLLRKIVYAICYILGICLEDHLT
jgi:hypothetical protein